MHRCALRAAALTQRRVCGRAARQAALEGDAYACAACRALPAASRPPARPPAVAPVATAAGAAGCVRVGRRTTFTRPFLRNDLSNKVRCAPPATASLRA
jgi:hypothetical protein